MKVVVAVVTSMRMLISPGNDGLMNQVVGKPFKDSLSRKQTTISIHISL